MSCVVEPIFIEKDNIGEVLLLTGNHLFYFLNGEYAFGEFTTDDTLDDPQATFPADP